MKKKIVGIFVIMLMISSAMTTILFSNNIKVEASGGEPQGGGMNLDYEFVWNMTKRFGKVNNDTDWSGENNIPKGRSWATAGENYTIAKILKPAMDGPNSTCGLTNYTNLSIGPLNSNLTRKYSSKIVIHNYGLTIHLGSVTKRIPYSEMFPIGEGCVPVGQDDGWLDQNFSFSGAEIKEKILLTDEFLPDHHNVSCDLLNTYNNVIGPVIYLNTSDPIPENHDCVFILHEEPASEEKLENLSDAMGCILIENASKNYTFENSEQYNYAIVKLSGIDNNFSIVLSEIKSKSVYGVDNIRNNEILVFSNYSNESCCPPPLRVYVVQLNNEGSYASLPFLTALWQMNPWCKGVIMSSHQEHDKTHVMTHTVRDWGWFLNDSIFGFGIINTGYYTNRYALPIFSVNKTLGNYLINNKESITVDGFLFQEYRQQTSTTPGVISHNVVAYRNITNSPNNAITVLSNRMDGWWGETPGDSGVGGAILLGIAKYFKDNNITPKYNLAFLFTTGEEYGMRGAQHYVDSHPRGTGQNEYNFVQWIGFDQLGFNHTFSTNEKHYLNLTTNNKENGITDDETEDVLNALGQQTDYEERTKNAYNFDTKDEVEFGAEDYIWNQTDVNTILIEKGNKWDGHHQVGNNYQNGDSLANIDQNDVNVTFELAWNITKYFTVDPDCWFDNISFIVFDSPNDGDRLYDSIRTNFTIHSVLPSDRVKVELDLSYEIGEDSGDILNAGNAYYLLTSRSQNESYIFTIPDTVIEGNYSVSFKLYNSTGCINKIVYGSSGTYYNDSTDNSSWYHLYHPLGYTKIGDSYKCVYDNISGSVFTANQYGRADNITAYINQAYMSPGPYQCMLYRASDGVLIGNTTSDWVPLPQGNPESSSWWAVFNFTGNKPYLVKGTQYVITCWGDSANSRVYYNESNSSETGRYYYQLYGDILEQVNFSDESRYYSIYCSYTPDITLPQIFSIAANPHTVGFGYNVTISADVTAPSGVNYVKAQIISPGTGEGVGGNYTMTHISGNTYQYVFSDTWTAGQYNYTIWAVDNASHVNRSTGHHFHVSADAAISISTLQDSYNGSQYINITDPPSLPEDYSLVGRGLTWDKYYNAITGKNILEASTEPINYQEDDGTWTSINNTLYPLASNHPAYVYGYRKGNNHGLYGVYFKSNAQNEWPVAFTYNRSDDPTINVVRSKLVGVGYVDPASDWAYEYLQNVQSSQGQTTDNTVTYEDVFTGTDVTWSYGNTGLKEEIILSDTTKTMLQSHPPSLYGLNNGSSYLVFITRLDHQNLNLYNASGMLSGNITISDTGVDFKDALGQFKCALPLGEAYELNDESVREKLTYRIIHLNGNTYILSGLKISDLNAMTFPVVIDPTMTIYTSSSDGYLKNSSSNYMNSWNAATASTGFYLSNQISIGQNKYGSTYTINRGYVFFNTSTIPTNANISNATLSLYKCSDSSDTDFLITIQNGQPTYPHSPLQNTDYYKAYYSGNGGTLNTNAFGNSYNNVSLTSNGISWINRTGWTKLCLRSSRDIDCNTPTGSEYVTVYTSEQGSSYTPKLTITYYNQSKIKNTGSTNIKGYLLIQIQFYNTSQGIWVLENNTIDETRPQTINSGSQLALDNIFNGTIRASDLKNGEGLYRVYTAFRDPEGNILKTDDGTELKSWYQFNKTL
jgi:hypothetical protein